MKRRLVVGLGNAGAGDDGVGCHLARRLEEDPRLPPDVDVVVAGLDLLSVQHRLSGRAAVLLLDAVLDDAPPGTAFLFSDVPPPREGGWGAHHPDPAQALAVLRAIDPSLGRVPVVFLGIAVGEVRVSPSLSPAVADAMERLVDTALRALAVA
jgi:hydrogenase maturation protease